MPHKLFDSVEGSARALPKRGTGPLPSAVEGSYNNRMPCPNRKTCGLWLPRGIRLVPHFHLPRGRRRDCGSVLF